MDVSALQELTVAWGRCFLLTSLANMVFKIIRYFNRILQREFQEIK